MYRVYCDSFILYDDRIENLKIFKPKVELELNKAGEFTFSIYPDHPYYNYIYKLKSIITVYQDDYMLFKGRVLNDEMGFYNEKQVTCEGVLAFFIDSIQRPFHFSGTVRDFLAQVIDNHNSQAEAAHQFALGNVTVDEKVTVEETEYENTWEIINKALIGSFQGFISVRHEDVAYIDYLSNLNLLATQAVTFGKNLLDIKRIRNGEEVATAVIPLGAKTEDTRLTIKEVNGGIDYIYDQDAVNEHSWIFRKVIFEDVTDAEVLLSRGKAYLNELVNLSESIELSAADLATVDSSITSFHIGTMVQVTSNPHGINQRFLVSKLTISLLNPAENRLVLGGIVKPFTETIIPNKVEKGDKGEKGEDAILLIIESSNGNIFKNNGVATTLTVSIIYGEKLIDNSTKLLNAFGNNSYLQWEYKREGETEFEEIPTSDTRLSDKGFIFTLNTKDVETRTVFNCKLIV